MKEPVEGGYAYIDHLVTNPFNAFETQTPKGIYKIKRIWLSANGWVYYYLEGAGKVKYKDIAAASKSLKELEDYVKGLTNGE